MKLNMNIATPNNVHRVLRFLGAFTHHKQMIPHLSFITLEHTALSKKVQIKADKRLPENL